LLLLLLLLLQLCLLLQVEEVDLRFIAAGGY
jgi:hypothetical protein